MYPTHMSETHVFKCHILLLSSQIYHTQHVFCLPELTFNSKLKFYRSSHSKLITTYDKNIVC